MWTTTAELRVEAELENPHSETNKEIVSLMFDAVRHMVEEARGENERTLFSQGALNERYRELDERAPVIPLRKGRVQPDTPIKRGTDKWKALYRRRSAVEREYGRLKHDYGLAFLRVCGIQRVRLHADLCILARLALALDRARALPAVA